MSRTTYRLLISNSNSLLSQNSAFNVIVTGNAQQETNLTPTPGCAMVVTLAIVSQCFIYFTLQRGTDVPDVGEGHQIK